MKEYTAVVEQDPETGFYVGYVPGFPGAHSQADTLDELNKNLEPLRVFRRLHFLRGWGHGKTKQILTRG